MNNEVVLNECDPLLIVCGKAPNAIKVFNIQYGELRYLANDVNCYYFERISPHLEVLEATQFALRSKRIS